MEYCLEEQANYYLGGREPDGKWLASGNALGIKDGAIVDNGQFRNLHEGWTADGQVQIGATNAKGERVGGYDIQFGAPKSVAILWALADDVTRSKIESCQERAVRAALGFMENAAGQIRTGHNGVNIEKVRIHGATFQHGEARPTLRADGQYRSDMLLHTHSIIFNIGLGADGKWRALDGRPLMAMQKAAGAQYHAELAHLLETELGAEIVRADLPESRHNGEFEIAGVSREVIDHFSTRRNALVEEMDKRGLATGDAAELASEINLANRKGKSDESREDQFKRWTNEAKAMGVEWDDLSRSLGKSLSREVSAERAAAYEDSRQALADRLTENESVFTEADIYAAIAAAGAGRGIGAIDAKAIAAEMLSSGEIVTLTTDQMGHAIFSTRAMVEIENRILTRAVTQAKTYKQKESINDQQQVSIPIAISETFAIANPVRQLDANASERSGLSQGNGMLNLSFSALGTGGRSGAGVVSSQAYADLGNGESSASNAVRRPNVRTQGGLIAGPHTFSASRIDQYLREIQKTAPRSAEQCTALHWIGCHAGTNVLVEGAAGSGKTVSVMQDTANLYFADGYKVLATAQRWTTALDLAKIKTPDGKNLDGRAAAKWIADYRAGKVKIDAKTVFLVDEAGQMGSREVDALMSIADETGCRIVWTGDRAQQKSASAGDPLSILARELGSFRLEQSQRMRATAADVIAWRDGVDGGEAHCRAMVLSDEQRTALVRQHGDEVNAAGAVWARQLADDFAKGRSTEALQALIDHDQLVWSDTHDESLKAAVDDWYKYKLDHPTETAIVAAARHVDVRELNGQMRERLRAVDALGPDLATIQAIGPNGDKYDLPLAIGDQIRIGVNVHDLKIHNGHIAIVRDIQPGSTPKHPLVTLDVHKPGEVVSIKCETARFAGEDGRARLSHSLASTNTLIQGATESALFGQTSSGDSSNSAYVYGSRARYYTKLYACREREDDALRRRLPLKDRVDAQFTDDQRLEALAHGLARSQTKKMTTDYQDNRSPAAVVLQAAEMLANTRNAGIQNEAVNMATQDKKQITEDINRSARNVAYDEMGIGTGAVDGNEALERSKAQLRQAVADALAAGVPADEIKAVAEAGGKSAFKNGEGAETAMSIVAAALGEQPPKHHLHQEFEARQKAAHDDYQRRIDTNAPISGSAGERGNKTFAEIADLYRGLNHPEIKHVTASHSDVTVDLMDGRQIKDAGAFIGMVGKMDDRAAQTMMALVVARGWPSVRIKGGNLDDKRIVARAAIQAGVEVSNPELRKFVKEVHKDQQAAMRGDQHVVDRARDTLLTASRDVQTSSEKEKPQRLAQLVDKAKNLVAVAVQAVSRFTERPSVSDRLKPDEKLDARFGQQIDKTLTRDVTAVQPKGRTTEIQFQGGDKITHHHQIGETVCDGTVTPQRAALMATLMAAEGHKSVHVSGTAAEQETLTKAALSAGLGVENAKGQQQTAEQTQVIEKSAYNENKVARSPGLDRIESDRICRELQVTQDPVEKFGLCERLQELAVNETYIQQAETTQMIVAQEIVASPEYMAHAQQMGLGDRVSAVADAVSMEHSAENELSEMVEAEAEAEAD